MDRLAVYLSKIKDLQTQESQLGVLLEPALIRAARNIYVTYCQLHSKLNREPIGVAIDPKTHRGQLLFTKRAILLPGERFISLNELEIEVKEHMAKVK